MREPVKRPPCAAFIALAAVEILAARALISQDCDGNGIPDDLDLMPHYIPALPLDLEPDREFQRVATDDFDGDDIDDLVTSAWNSGKVLLHSAVGDGTFRSPRELPFSGRDAAPTSLDLEPDGDADLLILDDFGEGLTVLLNQGASGFSAMPGPALDDGFHLLVAADIDADGDADFVAAGVDSESIETFMGGGNGSFEKRQSLGLGDRRPVLILAADADSDGDTDVLAATVRGLTGGEVPSVAVFRNEVGGRLSPAIHYPGYVSIGARTAGDFDDDGDLDFIVASAIDPPRLTLLPNTGRGEFPAAVELDSPGRLQGVVAVDFDADGDLDLGAFHSSGNRLLLLESTGSQRFEDAGSYDVNGSDSFAGTRDFNGDGRLDVILARGPAILFNRGDKSFRALGRIPMEGGVRRIVTGDLDGDGDTDLAGDDGSQGISVAFNRGHGTFGRPTLLPVEGGPDSLISADLDSDGDLDLVTHEPTGVWIARNSGAGAFSGSLPLDIPGALNNIVGLAVVDVDADGVLDVLLQAGLQLSVARNLGTGGFAAPAPLLSVPTLPVAADMNGDTVADLATFSQRERRVLLFTNDGSGAFVETDNVSIAAIPTSLILADIDGDGAPDVISVDETSLTLLENLGEGKLGNVRQLDTMERTDAIAVADLNVDGRSDLVVRARNKDSMFVGRGDGTFQGRSISSRVLFASNFCTAADLDGDGRAEVLSASFSGISIAYNESMAPSKLDCNTNRVPDECDVASGASADADRDGIPDECSAPAIFHRGDPNDDGEVNLTDVISLLDHLFRGGAEPRCLMAGDSDADGVANLTDAVFVLDFLFRGGPPPPQPGPPPDPCGAGTRVLPCEGYSSCAG